MSRLHEAMHSNNDLTRDGVTIARTHFSEADRQFDGTLLLDNRSSCHRNG